MRLKLYQYFLTRVYPQLLPRRQQDPSLTADSLQPLNNPVASLSNIQIYYYNTNRNTTINRL